MRRPVAIRTQVPCTNAVSQDVLCDPLRVDHTIVWRLIVAREGTNLPTYIELLFRLGVTDYLVDSAVPAAANLSVSECLGVHMPPEAQVVARFVGATLRDPLQVWAYGYYLEGAGEPEAHP